VDDDTERLFYLGVGPLAALLLGVALVPVRGFTTASNFTFVFLALTIVVGELGGRAAAVATAVASALSLDFFLTQPYLRLEIQDKHAVIAFLGLGGCGILAAILASERGRGRAEGLPSRKQLALLRASVAELSRAGPLASRLARILEATRLAFPVASVVVRDRSNSTVAASERALPRPAPGLVLDPETLLPPGPAGPVPAGRSLPLPPEGARLALVVGRRQMGWLDLWGNGEPASLGSRQALSAVARVVAVLLAEAERE
jgi:hypothetical protein